MNEVRPSPDLPAHLASLYVPSERKYLTPLDQRGIADIDQVFELAIRTYPAELPDFGAANRDRHHLYWTEEWWKDYASRQPTHADTQTVMSFRNSPPQIAYVPREIHQWIERSQIKPPPPSIEVMRRRNASWEVAALLLGSVAVVDKARSDYEANRHKTRIVLGHIPGITPKSAQHEKEFIEKTDEAYWLSEYEARLVGWQALVGLHYALPRDHRILERPRLRDARALLRRYSVRHGATIPQIAPDILAA